MKQFSNLISSIEITNKTNAKIDALVEYFKVAPDKDKLWVIALFSGKRPSRPVKTSLMKQWCMEITELPEWLFLESYSTVGDLGETIALLLPEPTHKLNLSLYEWMKELKALKPKSEEEKKAFVLEAWSGLNQQERLIFNKLIGGSFRIGVSKKTLVNALAKLTNIEPNRLMHSIIGQWQVEDISFEELIHGSHINYDNSKPYPFCLAYALEKEPNELGNPEDWIVEQKWDGIRGQIVNRNNEIFIWSRGEELVTKQFPELVEAFSNFKDDFVIDGEILATKDNDVLLFNDLQKRLNRKNVTKKLLEEVPIGFYAYDILEYNEEDIRSEAFVKRRHILEQIFQLVALPNSVKLSFLVKFYKWEDLHDIRNNSRQINSEGLMLKQKASPYHTGRKKGDWWKWKVDPLTIDAVMIYAQKGSGRRSSKYTDYTFAVKNDDGLVTVAKAYSGLTDKEITEISRWVNKNAIEKFGPVRTVKPELVFEIAFEGIALSNRHKSGVALRFPRISRWRKDKPVEEIDTIETVKQLITAS
ncbi:ATP-dependent DNA ligase [Winogradskyella sp. SYSU M77433]|uniref:ATP-dependent DNA ligase n=1 Tax=Winogradskyella sp. SYSU M77433 TaxID=3042722 RepID=UPI00248127DE|nr:ATP-dependent DNA ligase [Winogradskyella sp. SYSU M77433]MDH7912551.1 ATP-dependent DNA ligase [Winogradskyella sp. SYSU M77433]